MDSYQHAPSQYEAPEVPNAFARYSKGLGIATIITALMGTVYIPFMLGGLAIILGILSRGSKATLCRTVKFGIVTAVIGLVINTGVVVVVAARVYSLFTVPEYRQLFLS